MAIYISIIFISFIFYEALCLQQQSKVLIAGAGPAGLLSAHCLLSRNKNYKIQLLESREDPRLQNFESFSRAYSLGLNIRGQTAIKYFDKENRSLGLWQSIFSRGVETDSFFLHIGKKSFQLRSKSNNSDAPPTLLIPQNLLCSALLESLISTYSSDQFEIKYNTKLVDVDLDTKNCLLSDNSKQSYDLLIGADGVRSSVRDALDKQHQAGENTFYSESIVLPGQYKVMIQPCPEALEADAVHAMNNNKADYGLFLIPGPGNKTCVLLNYPSNKTPSILRASSTPEEIKQSFKTFYPLFGEPTNEGIAYLYHQSPSEARSIRCNRYHDSKSSILLLGDAAHSTGGVLGQGANSALMDVVVLDQCLDDTNDNLPAALSLFSQRQVPEGLALWELLQLPPKGPLGLLYQAAQTGRLLLTKKFKSIRLPTQTLLSQTLIPYTEIAKINQFWINRSMKSKKISKIVPDL